MMITIFLQKFLEERFLVKKFMKMIIHCHFTTLAPKKKIHALVIPKGKYIDLDDFNAKASDKEIVGLIKGISIVAKKLGISLDAGKGYRTLSNLSEHGGQEVPHLHFHLFGGEKVGKMVE